MVPGSEEPGRSAANSGWLLSNPRMLDTNFRWPVRGLQIGMALRAGAIAGAGQPQCALMLHVAIGAGWRERLIGVMDWPIVACQAGLIGRALLIAGLRDMAGAAFLPEQRVRVAERAGVIRLRTSRHGVPPSHARPTITNTPERIRRQRGMPRSVLK